jgi:uncharacterized protein YcgI (DUF1989 family)
MSRQRIEPQTGTAFEIRAGQRLQVIDVQGEQVSDLVSFSKDDTREWLSSGRSIDYAGTIYLTSGNILYSNRSRPMFTIEADTVGRHDFLLTPCSPETFSIIYNHDGHHPSCFENLWRNLARFAVAPDTIPTTFNVFMNVDVTSEGKLEIKPPQSKAGDYITLRAEMDMYVGLTACSAEMSNNYSFKPIHWEILEAG